MPDFANLTDYSYQALHALGNSELVPISSKYLIGKKGIFKIVNNGYPIPISLGLITLETKYVNPNGDLEYELAYDFEGSIKTILVSHNDLLPRRLQTLSVKGVPIDHNCVKDLSNALSTVGSKMIATPLSNHLGFSEAEDQVQFIGVCKPKLLTTNMKKIFDVSTKGTLKGEQENVKRLVTGYYSLELAYLLGLAAITTWILNHLLGIDVFPMFYFLFGDSSAGKTTATIVALSPFGNPSPRDTQSFVQTYASTDLSLIQYVSHLNGYAIGIDDFGSSNQKDKTSFLYTIVNGKAKSRATSEGDIIQGAGFEVTGIGNGEESIRDNLSDHVGVQLRVCEFNNLVYTDSSEHSEKLKQAFTSAYGHVAQEYADYLLKYELTQLKETYDSNLEELLQTVGKSPSAMVNRYAKQLSIISTTGDLANKAFDFDFNHLEIQKLLAENLSETMYRLDNANFVHTKIITYVYENLNSFEIHGTGSVVEGQLLGWIKQFENGDSTISIPVNTMKRIAKELLLPDLKPLMNKMKKERLIEAEKGHNTKKVKGIRCYVFIAKDFSI